MRGGKGLGGDREDNANAGESMFLGFDDFFGSQKMNDLILSRFVGNVWNVWEVGGGRGMKALKVRRLRR